MLSIRRYDDTTIRRYDDTKIRRCHYSSFFPAFSPTAVVELSAGVGACAVGIILKILAKYVS